MSHMKHFSVKAILRKDKMKQNGKCPINIKVTIEKKHLKLPIGLEAEPDNWKTKEGIFKEAKSSARNSALNKKINDIDEFLCKHVAAENDITLELVKNHFSRQKDIGFFALVKECIEFKGLKPTTQKHYLLVARRLKEFDQKLTLNDLDHKLPMRFETFLKRKGIGVDGIWQHHKVLKSIINYGIRYKKIKDNPYLGYKVKKGESRVIFLSGEQVKTIRDLSIVVGKKRKNCGLELTRDKFLFSCYTAARFGDVELLTKKNILNPTTLIIAQEKTGGTVTIPITPQAMELIEKYYDPKRETLFPSKSNQASNRDLKRIAEMCGIDINIHYHLSRHTFGSNMAHKLTAFELSKTMGHKNLKTTMIYVNSNVGDIRQKMMSASMFS